MLKKLSIAVLAMSLVAATGCSHDKKKDRPPVDELADGGRGLQGKDVLSASDEMSQSILSDPDLNASKDRWVIVVDKVENLSQSQRGRLDLFIDRVGVKLTQLGRGRVQMVSRKAALRDVQSRERDDAGSADPFGQGGVSKRGIPGRLQPDFALNATISELPNKSTSFFYVQFNLVNLTTGELVWQGEYPVATNR